MDKVYGPIQFTVVTFDDDSVIPGLLEKIELVRELGIIRLIDFLFVEKDEDGEIFALEVSDYSKEEQVEFGALVGGLIGLGAAGEKGVEAGARAGAYAVAENDFGASTQDILEIADDIPSGKAAMIALFEHTWAVDIKRHALEHGAVIHASGLLHPMTLVGLGEELAEAVEREEQRELDESQEEESHETEGKSKGTSTKRMKSKKEIDTPSKRERMTVHPEY